MQYEESGTGEVPVAERVIDYTQNELTKVDQSYTIIFDCRGQELVLTLQMLARAEGNLSDNGPDAGDRFPDAMERKGRQQEGSVCGYWVAVGEGEGGRPTLPKRSFVRREGYSRS